MTRELKNTVAAFVVLALGTLVPMARAESIVYENLPTGSSNQVSFHNATGPVLADDFIPTDTGNVTTVVWWGSAATSTQWEVSFHPNNPLTNQPAFVNATLNNAGGSAHGAFSELLTATATATSTPGLFRYQAQWNRSIFDIFLQANTNNWFSVANSSPGWTWALALNGPNIGSEQFNAQVSTSPSAPDGGPHGGPWVNVHTDFAFAILSVPEPASIVSASTAGLMGLACFVLRRRKTRHRLAG